MMEGPREALVRELESLSPMPDDPELEADQIDHYDDLVSAISRAVGDRYDERVIAALVYSSDFADT